MDAATGLLYVGNGQYYDPSTGRFLTRDARPNSSNPYVPFDPTGAIFGPLGAVALFFGRKKKGSKTGTYLVLLLVLGSVGMTLVACGLPAGPATATVISTPGAPVAIATATFADGTTVTATLPVSGGAPTEVLGVPCQTPESPTTSPLSDDPIFSGNWGAYPKVKQGVLEALDWVKSYVGADKTTFKGLQFEIVEQQGNWVTTYPKKITINEAIDRDVNESRTNAIHELGHVVDYHAGQLYFGANPNDIYTDNYSSHEGAWVDEWTRDDQTGYVYFTGNRADLASDYLIAPTATGCLISAFDQSPAALAGCRNEDFAETFTWMVYKHKGLALDMLDYIRNYQIPSYARQNHVQNAIVWVP